MSIVQGLMGSIAVLTVAAACSRTPPAVGGLSPERPDSVTIEVVNLNFYDANVYTEFEGDVQRRLGTVTGFQTETYTVPWRTHGLTMVMRLIGVGSSISNRLEVFPGDYLELRLLPNMHRRVIRR